MILIFFIFILIRFLLLHCKKLYGRGKEYSRINDRRYSKSIKRRRTPAIVKYESTAHFYERS